MTRLSPLSQFDVGAFGRAADEPHIPGGASAVVPIWPTLRIAALACDCAALDLATSVDNVVGWLASYQPNLGSSHRTDHVPEVALLLSLPVLHLRPGCEM